MTVVYAESSAILAWLLGEPRQERIIDVLSAATDIVTSSLTAIECARGLARARLSGRISAVEEQAALRLLDGAVPTWHVLDLSDDVASIARSTFPHEPVRTLDALHLATAVLFHEALGELDLLSLDERVRTNAAAVGMRLLPR
jgi:uncharacterized protein